MIAEILYNVKEKPIYSDILQVNDIVISKKSKAKSSIVIFPYSTLHISRITRGG